jgi:predicted nucleic acid-binding protein
MNAVDTNILIYIKDPRDPVKQRICADLLTSLTDQILLYQVDCEYLAASRKLATFGHSIDQAFLDIADLQRLIGMAVPSEAVFARAQQLLATYSLSFWDAMVVAACQEAGVDHLFTEEFDAYTNIAGVVVVNPFKP